MIESHSQAGHRRRMALSQSLAQSVSSLCCGVESGIKRIEVHWGSAAGVDLSRSEPEAERLTIVNVMLSSLRMVLLRRKAKSPEISLCLKAGTNEAKP
jgi:hypothetical protein